MKFLSILLIVPTISAFSVAPPSSSCVSSTSAVTTLHAESATSRRTLLSTSFIASAALMGMNLPAFAEEIVDDLAMPTEDEQAKAVSRPFYCLYVLCNKCSVLFHSVKAPKVECSLDENVLKLEKPF